MRNFVLLLMVVAVVGMTGCARQSGHVERVKPDAINTTVKSDEAAIVFFNGRTGKRYTATIVEADAVGNLSYVTIINRKNKYFHRTTPGKHLYFVALTGNKTSGILEANFEAGKTYYVRVFVGSAPELIPVVSIDELFRRELAKCSFVQNISGDLWFKDNIASLQTGYMATLLKNKTVIKPAYGFDTPVQDMKE